LPVGLRLDSVQGD